MADVAAQARAQHAGARRRAPRERLWPGNRTARDRLCGIAATWPPCRRRRGRRADLRAARSVRRAGFVWHVSPGADLLWGKATHASARREFVRAGDGGDAAGANAIEKTIY